MGLRLPFAVFTGKNHHALAAAVEADQFFPAIAAEVGRLQKRCIKASRPGHRQGCALLHQRYILHCLNIALAISLLHRRPDKKKKEEYRESLF